jgi:hypothetical protein
VEVRRAGGMALFKPQFGTGWMASGNAGGIETPSNQEKKTNEGALVLEKARTFRLRSSSQLRPWGWIYRGDALHVKTAKNVSSGQAPSRTKRIKSSM